MDLTGYWVSVITEDWKFRMVTPRRACTRRSRSTPRDGASATRWDPARDEAAGEQCRAYGAANIMRLPGAAAHRVGRRHARCASKPTPARRRGCFRFGAAAAAPVEPTWQGTSSAEWAYAGGRAGANRGGSLKVVTTNLRPGYIRKNGAPYSDKTRVTEYFDLNTAPNGDRWLTVTTKVEDPVYFTRP